MSQVSLTVTYLPCDRVTTTVTAYLEQYLNDVGVLPPSSASLLLVVLYSTVTMSRVLGTVDQVRTPALHTMPIVEPRLTYDANGRVVVGPCHVLYAGHRRPGAVHTSSQWVQTPR